jgi:hypothetical protein
MSTTTPRRMFADLELARRIERTSGLSCSAFAETRCRLSPSTAAEWIEVAGVRAVYDGVESPITQTFGLGIHQPAGQSDFDMIEQFYFARNAATMHEVCPLADASTLEHLYQRDYRPIEYSSVLFLPLKELKEKWEPSGTVNPLIKTRLVAKHELERFAEIAALGWQSEFPTATTLIRELATVSANSSGCYPFVAEMNGRWIATGSVWILEGVADLAGASTIEEARNQGAQSALLTTRLNFAAEMGCEISTMGALPGSKSQRNAERRGFRIAYTRTKWCRLMPFPLR